MASSETKTVAAPTQRRQIFRALEAKSLRTRNFASRLADFLTGLSSTPVFLFLNVFFFIVWIVINVGFVAEISPFDPFPFGLLTMFVSLEAIVLSIFVLVSQNRAAQIATLRDELNLRVNLIAEQEVTKILEILYAMRKKMNLHEDDPILEKMLQDVNATDLEQSIMEQIGRADKLISPKQFAKSDFSSVLSSLVKVKPSK
jgi:uncharacterized membrane protein